MCKNNIVHQVCTSSTEHLPVPHSVPVNPISQVQVSGAEQVPPFSQGGLQATVLVHYQGLHMVIVKFISPH